LSPLLFSLFVNLMPPLKNSTILGYSLGFFRLFKKSLQKSLTFEFFRKK
jgi:hypothetical protein